MNYEEIRSIAQDGDLLFFHVDKTKWLSRLVSWFTKSQYTHVGFLFWYCDRLMLVDSGTVGGMRIVLASKYAHNTYDLIQSPVPWAAIEQKALEKASTAKYGWFSAFYIGLREFMFKTWHIRLPPNNRNRNKACSEFVAEVLGFDDPDVTPVKLYNMMKERENERKVG